MKNVFMKNRNLDMSVLQNYSGAIQIIAAVALLKMHPSSRGPTYLGKISWVCKQKSAEVS